MANAGSIDLYDYGGSCICSIGTLQSENIGQDICCCLGNWGNREVDYICYIDKCGCHCCLSNENEIIIHTENGTLKTVNFYTYCNGFRVVWNECFGSNWAKTMVRYKSDTYPTSITDGTLAVEETIQNTYCSNGYCKTGLTGSYTYVKLFALDNNNNILAQCCGAISLWTDKVFGCTGNIQSFTMPAGTYKLQVRGASGFCCASYISGRGGGYSEGCITLSSSKTVYVAVGGHPTGQAGGYNGGGNGYYSYGMGGGGATDIRIGGNTLYHRVIVAGGSGGNNCTLACAQAQGGAGGGMYGMRAIDNAQASQGSNRDGGGAGPNYGGCAWSTGGSAGTFGQGGTSCSGYNAGGGGGGWYGGGGAYDNDSDNDGRGGGGGSGYVWTSANCQYHPAPACLSGIPYLTNATTFCGAQTFTSPTGGTETGHFGHGCAKITKI